MNDVAHRLWCSVEKSIDAGFAIELAELATDLSKSIDRISESKTMFDKTTLDSLVSNLEAGEADLTAKQAANTSAQSAAAQAQADLSNAQATNRANVAAIKTWASTIDDDGNAVAAAAAPVAATTTPATDGSTTATPAATETA